jgi:hypothetical protein
LSCEVFGFGDYDAPHGGQSLYRQTLWEGVYVHSQQGLQRRGVR